MRFLRILIARLRALVRRNVVADEIRDELQFHLEMRTEEYQRHGVPPDEARRLASRRIGNLALLHDRGYDIRGGGLMETVLQDIRYAVRLLRQQPRFSIVAILTLALGIGANAAIFSVVDAALFRPLPYKDADRLVDVYRITRTLDGQRVPVAFDGAHVDVVRAIKQVFEGVEVFRGAYPMALVTGADQSPWVGGFGPALPEFLGVRPRIGRGFTREDVSARDTIILSDGYWQRAFNRDPGVLGKTMAFSDRTYVVVGVMPPAFRSLVGAQADAWLPIADRDGDDLAARLRPGLTVEQAQRAVDAALAQRPPSPRPLQMQIQPADWNRAQTSSRAMLLSVMAAVGFVLLIACANVANLLLVRTLARQREIAVRGSLGATRGRLVRQFLIEGLVLAGLGAMAAAVVAWWGIRAIPAIMPAKLSQSLLGVSLPHPDLRVLAFGCLAVLVTGLCCGAVPAIRASRSTAAGGLLAGGQRIAGSSRGQRRIRHTFQAMQIALTLILLVGAGLLISSVLRMVNTPAGFDSDHLGYVDLNFPAPAFPLQAQKAAFADRLLARLSALPGVRGVALGEAPVAGGTSTIPLAPESDRSRAILVKIQHFYVGVNYFQLAGIPLKEGRTFGPEDQPTAPHVVIISENAARRLWPGQSAVGERLQRGTHTEVYTVVGVVPHLKTIHLASDDVELFFPASQFSPFSNFVVRTTGDVASVAGSIRAEVRAIDPRVTVARIGTVDSLFAEFDPLGPPRFYAVLLGLLAGLGLLTAAVGLYGLLSYAVSQRTHEIGVRIALGADRGAVRQMVIRDAFGPVALGIAAGLVAAAWLSRFVASQLYHVTPRDPATLMVVVAFLVTVCGLAVVVPVRRAMRIDAAEALRTD